MKFQLTTHTVKLLLCVLFSATACTGYMATINQDEKLISDDQLQFDANEGGFLLPLMMNRIVSTTTGVQTQQNLQAESYAGYLETPTPFLSNENTTTYFMVNGWNNTAWDLSTTGVMNNWLLMWKNGFETKYPDLFAIGTIIKVAAGHRLVDTFGPYPYSRYGTAVNVPFDSEEEAYNAFFIDLEKSVKALQTAEAADPTSDDTRFAKWDRSTLKGSYTSWIKLANTLRLRLALRISLVAPSQARIEAEKAVDPANGGLLDSSTGSFSIVPTSLNPYYTMANAWSDTRLAAPVETFLKGFNDPRLKVYAIPATDPALAGQIKGLRNGIAKPEKSIYVNFSLPNVSPGSAIKQVDAAESYFLRAEGALRGWDMHGTPGQFYEEGIRASFQLNGVSGVDDYLAGTTSQIAYTDPKNADNNSAPLSTISVKWIDSAPFAVKLEKIITQKWIALYPEGTEAWSEFRRTGFPKLYPVKVSYNTDLPLGKFIRRLTYPSAATDASQDAVNAAVNAYLGGKDSAASPLWWDVD